jgi:DNA-binding helix-hairpin-helix protein with protein kinase domain
MDEQEIVDALIRGALLHESAVTGEVHIVALDDMSADVRECFRASRAHDREHQRRCPDCLENEARPILMDAASHREDGNEADALALEAEAAELLNRAAGLRGEDLA